MSTQKTWKPEDSRLNENLKWLKEKNANLEFYIHYCYDLIFYSPLHLFSSSHTGFFVIPCIVQMFIP